MTARLPRVAVVGRQNVGKSTLVNRLAGTQEAIAHETPGVTRDRVELPVTWRGRTFLLVDTGGYARRAEGIEALVSEQAEVAARTADLVLFVVDTRTGTQEEDLDLARRLRKEHIPVLVAANKVDSDREEADATVFHELGLGEPMPVSALHGRTSGELLDRILDLLPTPDEDEGEVEGEPRLALVGRPNVGKSSLFNRLVGEQRSVVYEEAGTTRDAVDALIDHEGQPVRFVDTAGLRRAARMHGLDYYGLVRSSRAIDRAHVCLLLIDASEGFTADDKHIAARVVEAGRGLVVSANKWDLVPSEARDDLFKSLGEDLAPFCRAPVLRTSAKTGQGVNRIVPALLERHEAWTLRAPTSEVNRVVEEAQGQRPAPRAAGRYRYATQVSAGPPTFVLFGGKRPDPGYVRFLENRLRQAFGLAGIPVRIRFRERQRKGPQPGPGPRNAPRRK
jgi:GTP-binding protein